MNKDTNTPNNSLAKAVASKLATPQVMQFRQVMVGIYQAHKNSLLQRLGSEEAIRNKLASVVMYADRNPKLMECTPQSLWTCISASIDTGWWPVGFPPMAYYIPFRDNKNNITIATFVPHYSAFVNLMLSSGYVKKIVTKVVRSKDEFDYIEGSGERIIHRSYRGKDADAQERIGVYCITVNKYEEEQITYLSADQIAGIKSKSRAATSGPWASNVPLEVDWMWMKSAIKQHWKLMPSCTLVLVDYEDEREPIKTVGLDEVNPFLDGSDINAIVGTPSVVQGLPDVKEGVSLAVDKQEKQSVKSGSRSIEIDDLNLGE